MYKKLFFIFRKYYKSSRLKFGQFDQIHLSKDLKGTEEVHSSRNKKSNDNSSRMPTKGF